MKFHGRHRMDTHRAVRFAAHGRHAAGRSMLYGQGLLHPDHIEISALLNQVGNMSMAISRDFPPA